MAVRVTGRDGEMQRLATVHRLPVPAQQTPVVEQAPVEPDGVPVTLRVTVTVWAAVVLLLAAGVALVLLVRRDESCDRLWCTASTLGGHPLATLTVAAASLAVFAGLVWPTRGFTRISRRQFVAVLVATAAGAVAVIGALVVIVVVVTGVLLASVALYLVLASMARS